MSKQPQTGFKAFLFVFASGLAVALAGGGASALAASPGTSTAGAAAHPVHSAQTLPAALRPALYQALAKDAGAAWRVNSNGCAVLPKQALKACFDNHGAHFNLPADQAGGAVPPLSLHLVAFGRSSELTSVGAVRPTINGNQASYVHGNLTEWWRVLPIGFEQGFTIAKRPSGNGGLTLALAASRQDAGAPNKDTLAWGKLRYGQLVVTDANGKVVPATLTNKGDRVLIAVNDAHAVYPLTVDPLVWLEQKVTESDGATFAFGFSAAVSGTTALVGASNPSAQGAVYVFTESNGTWAQTARLTASDGVTGDHFGFSVALATSGATVLVGAPFANVNGNVQQGAAYVFTDSGGTWTQAQKLTASDGTTNGHFGQSAALVGTTALVGAPGAGAGAGAAYVFNESDGSWTQTQKLTASDGVPGDEFGWAVTLAAGGATALVGAITATVNGNTAQGAAYVFAELNGTWTQTQKLTASDGATADNLGFSVALDGPTALVGAAFADVNGNAAQGAAYVFNDSGGTWTQTAKLTASDGAVFDQFGWSVALDGATALIGAPTANVNGNVQQGAAYVFTDSGGAWTQALKLVASDGASPDNFGSSVALDGTTGLVGAFLNNGQGAAYFEGESDLGFAVSAPETVAFGQDYLSQTIATNNASAASPAVSATMSVPAAASFISATATQGSCSEAAGVVTCDFGAIPGNAGTATANVTLKAAKNTLGTTIANTASVVHATPALSAGAATAIVCPTGYTEYDGTLAPGERAASPRYQAPAGVENGILISPPRFRLFVPLWEPGSHHWQVYGSRPDNAIHRWGPAARYRWIAKAWGTSDGGAYALCVLHP